MPTLRQCKSLLPYCLFHLLVGVFASLHISVFFFSVVRSEVPKESRHHLHRIKNHVALEEIELAAALNNHSAHSYVLKMNFNVRFDHKEVGMYLGEKKY